MRRVEKPRLAVRVANRKRHSRHPRSARGLTRGRRIGPKIVRRMALSFAAPPSSSGDGDDNRGRLETRASAPRVLRERNPRRTASASSAACRKTLGHLSPKDRFAAGPGLNPRAYDPRSPYSYGRFDRCTSILLKNSNFSLDHNSEDS